MCSALLNQVRQFLRSHHDSSSPLLLALSGGVDSIVLFDLLKRLSSELQFKWAIAHVDHGWRSESKKEADSLCRLAQHYSIPFYLKTLQPSDWKSGNSEEICRYLRLQFFKELIEQHGFQAVLLAHHADDQAETVLKRLFENGSLTSLQAMAPVVNLHGIPLWRPLLSARKEDLYAWARECQLSFFEDSTNQDPTYLRSRCRLNLLPFLTAQFGKEIKSSLCHIAQESALLHHYIQERLKPLLQTISHSFLGVFISKEQLEALHPFEQLYLIKLLNHELGEVISRDQLQTLLHLIQSCATNKYLAIGLWQWHVERGHLFLLPKKTPSFTDLPLTYGLHRDADWKFSYEPIGSLPINCRLASSWQDLMQGEGWVVLPEGEYCLSSPLSTLSYPRLSSLSKWWGRQQVPYCLRQRVPLLKNREGVFHEFLSGRVTFELTKYERWVKIRIWAPTCSTRPVSGECIRTRALKRKG